MNDQDERDHLVAALEEYGIRFLARGEVRDGARLQSGELIAGLAKHPDPRLHLALTSLFLLHPDWTAFVPQIVTELEGAALVELQARYMAAVYLQRFWKTRLTIYLDEFPALPDLFSSQLALPPADERFGKTGLIALAEWHKRRSKFPFNRLASYQKSIELLIGQLIAEKQHHEYAATREPFAH